jgi:hypothetical protein
VALPTNVPADWTRLATFVHLSDLHIGEVNPGSGDAVVSAVAARLYATGHSFLDGLLGHHGQALEDLEAFVGDLRDEGEDDLNIIVTGDMTRVGHYVDYANAKRFFEQWLDLRPPTGTTTAGLGLKNVDLIIPGNHDHWGGSFVALGGGPSQYASNFRNPLPYVHHCPRLANGRKVVFVGIDSDADVFALSHDRQLALGKFESQLVNPGLPADPQDIRMMLIHHSWYQSGKILRMRTASKDKLGEYLVRYNIKGILTGHSHAPLLDFFTINPQQVDVYELRAGTASQLDQTPASWRTVWKTLPTRKWEPNSVLVHRVFQDTSGTTHWHAQVYRRSETDGFEALYTRNSSIHFRV